MTDLWRDIPGYEGKYQASTTGRIRSVDRSITQIGRWGKEFTRLLRGKVLQPGRYCKTGHVSVVLGKGTNGKPVHQLVLLTFKGPPPNGLEVRHINGIPTDNRLDNLIYGTRTDNILDVYRQGGAWRKLTGYQALLIKKALEAGESGASLAKKYDVSQSTISGIKLGRNFWWLP